jgi:predicted nucleotidyltransferase
MILPPTDDPREALRRLEVAASSGALSAGLAPFSVRVLAVFGSVLDEAAVPSDLDLAFGAGEPIDLLDLRSALYELTGLERVDLVDLDQANLVLRAEALSGRPLFEDPAGTFASEQMTAIVQRLDTRWLRELDLEAMTR